MYMNNQTIKHHLATHESEIADWIMNTLYVDVITGTNDITEGEVLQKTSKEILKEMSMNLAQWNTNDNELMQKINESDRAKGTNVTILGTN